MNSAIVDDLARHVDQAVAGVAARPARRQQMRQELLAHLLALFDEELERLGDEHSAAAAARTRFGHCALLAGELHASVPLAERMFFVLVRGKGPLMWRWLFLIGVVAVLIGLGFIMPQVAHLTGRDATSGPGEALAFTLSLLTLGCLLTLAGLGSLGWGVKAFRARKFTE